MDSLSTQENPGRVASCDASAEPPSPSREHNRQSPSHSSYGNLNRDNNRADRETKVLDPLLCKFLSSLNAKRVASHRDYQIFTIPPGAYAKTLESLRESDHEVWGYVVEEQRHDLINDKLLIVKMLSTIHELTVGPIGELIKSRLAVIANETSNEDTKRLVRDIRSGYSRSVHIDGFKAFRQPDKQFFIKGSYFPGIVIEVAYSESFKELRRKAYDLIVGSEGSVQLVIGLEIESENLFKLSTWRPEYYRSENGDAVRMKATTNQDIIRDSDGTFKPGCLRFHLQDFGTDLATNYPDAELTKEIALDYDVLNEYLIEAEQCDVPEPPLRNIIKSEHSSSSEEELAPEDEMKVRDQELRSAARLEASDPDYS